MQRNTKYRPRNYKATVEERSIFENNLIDKPHRKNVRPSDKLSPRIEGARELLDKLSKFYESSYNYSSLDDNDHPLFTRRRLFMVNRQRFLEDFDTIRPAQLHTWTKGEAKTLIMQYGRLAWNGYKTSQMLKHVDYFRKLWNQQEGLCAITGLPLFGGPELLGYGIGIDIIRPKFGFVISNLRLTSFVVAMARCVLRHKNFDKAKLITIHDLDDPTSCAIVDEFIRRFIEIQDFNHLPIKINARSQGKHGFTMTISTWVCKSPVHAEAMLHNGPTEIATISLNGDTISCTICDRISIQSKNMIIDLIGNSKFMDQMMHCLLYSYRSIIANTPL